MKKLFLSILLIFIIMISIGCAKYDEIYYNVKIFKNNEIYKEMKFDFWQDPIIEIKGESILLSIRDYHAQSEFQDIFAGSSRIYTIEITKVVNTVNNY